MGLVGVALDELITRASKVLGRQADDLVLALLADRIASAGEGDQSDYLALGRNDEPKATKVETDV
jgi:hypothetical protein